MEADIITINREPIHFDNETKYNIYSDGKEIYEVDFKYNTEKDSILIAFYDKKNIRARSRSIGLIGFERNSLICNYEANLPVDTTKQDYDILFGITNPDHQFVTLYQFKAGEIQTEFILQSVPKDVYESHTQALVGKYHIDSLKASTAASIDSLRSEMKNYKESTLKDMQKIKDSLEIKELAQPANAAMQENFDKKMDSIFNSYFKNIHPFNEEAYEVRVSLTCNGKGKTFDSTLFFTPVGGPEKSWLIDSLNRVIRPEIENEVFRTRVTHVDKPNLKLKFEDWYSDRFNHYKISDGDSVKFSELKKNIEDTLSTYKKRNINSTTRYNYEFNYNSTVKDYTCKYESAGDGTDKFIDKTKDDSVEITDDLKAIFRKKFVSQGNGQYHVKIWCFTIKNNRDTIKIQDIQLISKK